MCAALAVRLALEVTLGGSLIQLWLSDTVD